MNEGNVTKVQHEEAHKWKQSKTMKMIELNWKTKKENKGKGTNE